MSLSLLNLTRSYLKSSNDKRHGGGDSSRSLHFTHGALKGHLSVWVTAAEPFLTCSGFHSDHLSPQRKWRRPRERGRCLLPAANGNDVKVQKGQVAAQLTKQQHMMVVEGDFNALRKFSKSLRKTDGLHCCQSLLWTESSFKRLFLCIN